MAPFIIIRLQNPEKKSLDKNKQIKQDTSETIKKSKQKMTKKGTTPVIMQIRSDKKSESRVAIQTSDFIARVEN